jgi:hypothetical protein
MLRIPTACFLLWIAAAPAAAPPRNSPAAHVPPGGALTTAEATALTRELMPRVEQIRGRRFLRPVPVEVVGDEAARKHFASRLEKYHPAEELRAEQDMYTDLGLLPPGEDLSARFFSLLEEQAGGYYDPDSDTFFVLDDMPRAAGPVLIAHELTHALDDQHFSIDTFFDSASADDDRATVAGAVVEGSGSVVMTAYLIEEMRAGRMDPSAMKQLMETEAGRAERLDAAPAILQRALLAPYLLGQTLTLRGDPSSLGRGVKPDDIDRLFREPPVSTEQLLHPEKYWDAGRKDPPRAVAPGDLSATLGDGWRLGGSGVLGELTLSLVCGASNPSLESVEATQPAAWTSACATGWGGDRWQIYRNGERHVTVVATVWDTEQDAIEFLTALGAAGRRPARRGNAVCLVLGGPAERAEALSALAGAVLDRISAPPPSP